MPTTRCASTRPAQFMDRRVRKIHHKTQADTAKEAGFNNANVITTVDGTIETGA